MELFSPVFSSAILYGGLVRIIELMLRPMLTGIDFAGFWLMPRIGRFVIGDLVLGIAVLFAVVITLTTIGRFKSFLSWVPILFSLFLLYYCAQLRSRSMEIYHMFLPH